MATIYDVTIRRDAHTHTPVQAGMHEVAILKDIFGDENVTVGKQAGDAEIEDTGAEYGRLSNKYGPETMQRVYGPAGNGQFERAVERAHGPAKEERRQGKETAKAEKE